MRYEIPFTNVHFFLLTVEDFRVYFSVKYNPLFQTIINKILWSYFRKSTYEQLAHKESKGADLNKHQLIMLLLKRMFDRDSAL